MVAKCARAERLRRYYGSTLKKSNPAYRRNGGTYRTNRSNRKGFGQVKRGGGWAVRRADDGEEEEEEKEEENGIGSGRSGMKSFDLETSPLTLQVWLCLSCA